MIQVVSIYDLVTFPRKFTYEPKDVVLIINGVEEDLLDEYGEARFTEEKLLPYIQNGTLWYKKRGQ